MKKRREWSLRFRLSLFFALLLFGAWLAAAVASWRESMAHLDAFFDTQQMLFAKRLAASHYSPVPGHLPDTDDILAIAGKGDQGEQEDDALAFAVFTRRGRLLLSDGENGKKFVFSPDANGFVNTRIKGDLWRIVWLTSMDKRVVVAVGQELEYRNDMAFEILGGQMLPWLFLLPVLLLGLTVMLSRELGPLRSVAADLRRRSPTDVRPIETRVQPEVLPLVQALNSLFSRFGAMLQRERAFIANAAHELRTPLAGLSIQAQVAQSSKQPEKRQHALAQLRKSITRTSRLVDQLLLLFKLETFETESGAVQSGPSLERSTLAIGDLAHCALEEVREQVEAKNIVLSFKDQSGGKTVTGQKELLEVLLRNVFGNAAKYTPESGTIEIILDKQALSVSNTSPEIAPADAARLGERFFRPPGQSEPGSGLGLSIANRIAQLHRFALKIDVAPGRFLLQLTFG